MGKLEDGLIADVNKMLVNECKRVAFRYYNKGSQEVFGKLDRTEDQFNSYTNADTELEKTIKRSLSRLTSSYGFIGEESSYKEDMERRIVTKPKSGRYWVIDPIDGTFAFRKGIPTWGISVGLMEERPNGLLKILMGSVYMPCIDTIFHSNGTYSYETSKASEKSPRMAVMAPPRIEDLRHNNIVTVGNDRSRKAEFLTEKLRDEMPGSYVAQILGVVKGQYLGTIMRARIWDLAGCHAVAKTLGVKVYDAKTRGEVEDFKRRDFFEEKKDKWKLKKTHIVCYEFTKDILFSKLREIK